MTAGVANGSAVSFASTGITLSTLSSATVAASLAAWIVGVVKLSVAGALGLPALSAKLPAMKLTVTVPDPKLPVKVY